ncbi:MAG: heparinase II/III family protein, partial [Bacteroidales bacterium]|nr:heparinase II/III family protein [Bacteroidales bacterium]
NMKQNALRWTMLAFNNRSHSTLTVNGKDHVVKGFAPMTATFTDPARMGASFDLKNVFGGDLRKAERTGAIIDGSYLEITDRLAAPDDRPARVRWTMVTPAEPEITPEGILLRQGSITMILSASGAPLTYKTWSTDPMDYDSPTKTFEPRVNGTWLVGFETELAAGQSADLVTTLKRKK